MKTISVMIPTYNEEENAVPIYEAVRDMFRKDLPEYDYEILFIDNKSRDNTREKIRSVCAQDPKVKAIFNAKNFGQFNSPYYGLIHTTGDAAVSLCADCQDPVDMIPKFVREWEKGYQIVCAVKTSSRENGLVYGLRSLYYRMIRKMSSVDLIEHFTGFGLYDRAFLDTLAALDDTTPFYRGLVAEYGASVKTIPYEQAKRRAGKTSNNVKTLYDAAWLSFTTYTKGFLRLPAILGAVGGCLTLLGLIVYLVLSLIFAAFDLNTLLLIFLIGVGFLNLAFLGVAGEYLLALNERAKKRPLVVEEERLNW